ncbi:MAG: polymerase III subunit beta protein [candidate division TM6 bacterium GW2011_GWE2_41_16]|nr:MAG: polymerase III subunit beta protein [candidate division TM6 bacterium GW2011_GWE2_41_16]
MSAKSSPRVSVAQKKLSSVLAALQPICTKRSTMDVTSSVFLHFSASELVVKSTDLEISLQASIPFESSSLKEPVSILVPGKRLFDLVRELDEELFFELNAQKIQIISGGTHATLAIQSPDAFPPFPERIENLLCCPTQQLVNMLDSIVFMVPQNASNSALNGLFVEIDKAGCSMTATDGHCLGHIKNSTWQLETRKTWLIPRRAVIELKKIIEELQQKNSDNQNDKNILIGVCGNQLVFSGETFNFFTKLLADQYPQYHPILSFDGFSEGKISKTAFIKALRRSASLLGQQFLASRFSFEQEKQQLVLSFKNKEVGELQEVIKLDEFTGDSASMYLYAPYVISGIQNCVSTQQTTFLVKAALKPFVIKFSLEEHVDGTYLVMPVSSQQAV